ncbi:MAG: tRNA lysidine(34) synthetase TilS [Patescibacteria group bacterium]|nr:tRNA lysidine(34) synthetase TilS [Patescibacteria group bacterium]
MIILNKVQEAIENHRLIKDGGTIIVACSGGPDSVCLTHILWQLQKKLGFKIILAHLNHNLRGKESDSDSCFVQKLAKELNLPLENKKLRRKPKNEATAREARYTFLEQVRKKHEGQSIAAAHTADDQAETILLNLLRGAGLAGLAGMRHKNNFLIRPLLECGRGEILGYLKENRLAYRNDSSNFDLKYTRNKIRHKLLPLLKKEYNPQIRKNLLKLGEVSRAAEEYISEEAKNFICRNSNPLPLKSWQTLPPILKTETLRQMIGSVLGGAKDIYAVHLEEMVKMLESPRGNKKKNLPRGLQILKKDGRILVFRGDKFNDWRI